MDFDALMRKKLGGNKELIGVPEPGNDPATPLDLALGITPPAPAPVDLQDQGINLPPLQTNPRPKKTSPKGPLAMMRPRVKCSRCDFTGKQGKEMDSHVERKHKTEFKCKVCNFVTRTKALRRRHMKSNHERKVKCENQQWGLGQNCFFNFQEILHTFKNSFLVENFEHRRELCGFFFQPILTQFQGIDVVDPGLEIIVCPHFYKLPRWWLSQNWRKVGSWFKNRRNEDWKKVKVWTQYAPHLKHIFLQGFEKGSFYISNPTHCENREVGGGYHPLGWNLLKMGGNSPPGGISPPFPFCQIWEGGDITTFLESYAKWGGFHTWGGYHPLVPIWPQSTGGTHVPFF